MAVLAGTALNAWGFAFVRYYGLSFMAIGTAVLLLAPAVTRVRGVLVASMVGLVVGWAPLLVFSL